MDNKQNRRRLSVADVITCFRIVGSILLLIFRPLSTWFFILYALTGVTDALDGWIARKKKTADTFGARLDSIADLLFYTVVIIRLCPVLFAKMPIAIWYAVAGVVCIRISSYILAAIKYRLFASLHTYLNKMTGLCVFLIPFLLVTPFAVVFCWIVVAIAALASSEELYIHVRSKRYCPNRKSILIREKA